MRGAKNGHNRNVLGSCKMHGAGVIDNNEIALLQHGGEHGERQAGGYSKWRQLRISQCLLDEGFVSGPLQQDHLDILFLQKGG
jgi:hypothetical protein